MWRALALFVGILLAAGTYAAIAGDLPVPAGAPLDESGSPPDSSPSLGFALAAGAIALAATLMIQRPRRRFR